MKISITKSTELKMLDYTDRIQDTALILNNYIIDGPSHQLRPVNNVSVDQNIVFKKGTPRFKKN